MCGSVSAIGFPGTFSSDKKQQCLLLVVVLTRPKIAVSTFLPKTLEYLLPSNCDQLKHLLDFKHFLEDLMDSILNLQYFGNSEF